MRTQQDYETQPMLAVFASAEEAAAAVDAVSGLNDDVAGVERLPLGPGSYELEDLTIRQGLGGVWRGALWGLVVGVAIGLALAFGIGRATPLVLLWFGVTGGGLGLLIGGFVGAITRARFTEDVAGRFTVPAGRMGELVVVHTGGPEPRVREALRRAGARGFLDPTTPAAIEAVRDREAMVEAERSRRAA